MGGYDGLNTWLEYGIQQMHIHFWVENFLGNDYLQGQKEGRIILQCVLKIQVLWLRDGWKGPRIVPNSKCRY